MTKKSKRRALKTGIRTIEGPRSTTVVCGIKVDNTVKDEETEEEDVTENKKLTRSQKKQLKEQMRLESLAAYKKENDKRLVYPIDLWFLLAQKLQPEQVKVFSLICKGAYFVITTRKFWLDLYKRCVSDFKILPCHLTPNAITTNVGLKARVVRSLYYSYTPYMEKLSHITPTSLPLGSIEMKCCQSYWWNKGTCKCNSAVWMFYFKLVPPAKTSVKNNMFKIRDLIKYNSEENSCLLRITASSFVNIANVSRLILTGVGVSVSRDMQHQRVNLTFHEYRRNGKYVKSQAVVVHIDPIIDVQFLPWWHPEYPHPLDE